MLVSDLDDHLHGQREETHDVVLGQLNVVDDASRLEVTGSDVEVQMDEQAIRSLAKHLDVNKTYLAKCPPDLRQTNLNYWLRAKENAEAVLRVSGNKLVAVHQPGLMLLPLPEVANIITRNFNPDDEIVQLLRDDEKFHIDIKTGHHVEVEEDTRITDRTRGDKAVGDITHGGVRILASPTERVAPQVHTFLYRLWCSNGCSSPTAESTIRLRGHTIPEILVELEEAAQSIMGGMEQRLADYANTASQRIPGNPTAFVYALADEHNLGPRLTDRLIRRTIGLPEDVSLYDVMNIFTEVANQPNINYRSASALQGIGGEMAFHANRTLHRCGQCERPLPD